MRRSLAPSQRKLASTPDAKRRRMSAPASMADKALPLVENSPGVANCAAPAGQIIDKAGHERFIRELLAKPFRVPLPNYTPSATTKTLGRRRPAGPRPLHDPFEEGALVLSIPSPGEPKEVVHVVVDPVLSRVLRPHQREGVKFMYDCLTGIQIPGSYGCIMADEMGLGKTLQTITVLWTLVRQGPTFGRPLVKKALIVTPSSLVKNWGNELGKWLGERARFIALEGGSGAAIDVEIASFLNNRCVSILILSYETLRAHLGPLKDSNDVELVVCDEGHRLKNADNQTYRALSELKTPRRLLLSGTPIQNDLLEYFSLVHFVNNGILGTAAEFRKKFENPILRSRDAYSTETEQATGRSKLDELVAIVNRCLIRRTNALLAQYLPTKHEIIVCCRLTETQRQAYKRFSQTYDDKSCTALAAITQLKKICNHPCLAEEDMVVKGKNLETGKGKGVNVRDTGRGSKIDPAESGKFLILDGLLAAIKTISNDKVVIVSNYTQTMELFEQLCRMRGYGFVRLDGSMSSKKRDLLVKQFNDPQSSDMVFLLSSKAGGCGLNIIGANRLVMFDPDWNPASDQQAMARVWRDGQKKDCFVYRFISTGTIEEKIFQRQTHKTLLSSVVVDSEAEAERHFSFKDLRDLFRLDEEEFHSSTHSQIKCTRCVNNIQVRPPPEDADVASDLSLWHHHHSARQFNADPALKKVWQLGVTFVFAQRSHKAKKVP
ncbi:DNA repair and recombination protein RAD54-like [Tropilaelaps mercedesae]|uniref:DNA repair and recombination protein RAD54-like n=1 Tax=Tropilaelaps mercedesae TaxID=418985 RepID=A0A1V9XCZ7_9ACAR|nr:DNA repair and recombination protein RAD54-like [Tropilaelaps mercedesae]